MEIAAAFYFEGSDPETERTEYAPKFAKEVMQALYTALVEQKKTYHNPEIKEGVVGAFEEVVPLSVLSAVLGVDNLDLKP